MVALLIDTCKEMIVNPIVCYHGYKQDAMCVNYKLRFHKMAIQRSISWRRICPDKVSSRTEEALSARFYILHQTGPTAFVLKEEQCSRKVRVYLGNPNVCSCSEFKKDQELCIHILWILLKKFRIPRTNPLVWQQALIEREIDEILLGYLQKQPPSQSDRSKDHTKTVEQREIGPGDVCPICQDDLLGTTQSLVYCRFGCGQSIHTKCMKIMANHQRSIPGGKPIQCPLCRVDFGPIQTEVSKSAKRLRAERASLHLGVACSHCHVCPISGKCYKCTTCISYHLCHSCFSSNEVHILHPFLSRMQSNQRWRPVDRSSHLPSPDSPTLPPALVSSLQSRSLTENDYELLLQLDVSSPIHSPQHNIGSQGEQRAGHMTSRTGHMTRGVPERVINALHVEPLERNHPLLVGGASCQICGGEYTRGDWIKKLPCRHKFHRECVHEWLRTNRTCPIDDEPVYTPPPKRKRRSTRQSQDTSRQDKVIPLTIEVGVLVGKGQRSSDMGQFSGSVEFEVFGQRINRESNPAVSGEKRPTHRPTKDSVAVPTSHRRCSPSRKTSSSTTRQVPHNTMESSVTRHTENSTNRSKRWLTVSIPSGDNPIQAPEPIPPQTPVSSRRSQSEVVQPLTISPVPQPTWQVDHKASYDITRPGAHARSLLKSRQSSNLSYGEDVLLPSLAIGGPDKKPSVVAGGRLFKGSPVYKQSKKSIKGSELDRSLQVGSFKLCSLPSTNSMLTSAGF